MIIFVRHFVLSLRILAKTMLVTRGGSHQLTKLPQPKLLLNFLYNSKLNP